MTSTWPQEKVGEAIYSFFQK